MAATVGHIAGLIWRSIAAPAQVGTAISRLGLPRDVLWMALGLATVLSVLAMYLTGDAVAAIGPGPGQPGEPGPLANALILGSMLVMTVFALHFAGQALGGQGQFPAALAMVAWLEVVGMALRLGCFALGLVLGPVFAGALPILAAVMLGWIMLHFVRALHGFAGLGRAVATLALAILGLGLGLMAILAAIDILSGGALHHV